MKIINEYQAVLQGRKDRLIQIRQLRAEHTKQVQTVLMTIQKLQSLQVTWDSLRQKAANALGDIERDMDAQEKAIADDLLFRAAEVSESPSILTDYLKAREERKSMCIVLLLGEDTYMDVQYYWAFGRDALTLTRLTDLVLQYVICGHLAVPTVAIPLFGFSHYQKVFEDRKINSVWLGG
jgi:hypothetical protein